ncbi:MAG TPA: hypothetical protein VMW25_05595 [Clostridia bacterium]|nr:hypothetical protein [Clostridia bacterium]
MELMLKPKAIFGLIISCCLPFFTLAPVFAESLSVSVNVGTTTLTFSGLTSPWAQVTFLEDEAVVGTTQADGDGNFSKSLIYFESGIKTVSIYATDSQNRATSTVSYSVNLTLGQETTISNIVLPPTIELSSDSLTAGESLTIGGEAAPLATINLFFSNSDTGQSTASSLGSWEYLYSTGSLTAGTYSLYAKAGTDAGYQSENSQTKTFTLIALPTATPTPGPTSTPTPGPTTTPTITPKPTLTLLITPAVTTVPGAPITTVSVVPTEKLTQTPLPVGPKFSLISLVKKAKKALSESLLLQIIIVVLLSAPILYFLLPFVLAFFVRIKIFSFLSPNQGQYQVNEVFQIKLKRFKVPAGTVRIDLEFDYQRLAVEAVVLAEDLLGIRAEIKPEQPGVICLAGDWSRVKLSWKGDSLVKLKFRARMSGEAHLKLKLVAGTSKVICRAFYLILSKS